jgi:Carboxypeptidase regulatory-like domain
MSRPRIHLAVFVCVAMTAIATLLLMGDTPESNPPPTEVIEAEETRSLGAATVSPDQERATVDVDDGAGAATATATLATIVLQVDEIDRCIDPAGSSLSIRDRATGRTLTTILDAEGGALFEAVPLGIGGSEFEIVTGVADRRCFPTSFEVAPSDLEGEPPSCAISVALIHEHGLRGRVFDAASRQPIADATVEVDSFAVSRCITDSEGHYSLDLPEPRGSLVVRAPGYQEFWWSFPERRADGSTWLPSERDFELLRDPLLSILEFHVTRDDGGPAAGAYVEFEEGSDIDYSTALHSFADVSARDRYLAELAKTLAGVGRVMRADGNPPIALDESGSITVHVMMPCALRVIVRAGDERAEHDLLLAPATRERIDLSTRAVRSATAQTDLKIATPTRPLAALPIPNDSASGRVWLSHVDGGGVPSEIRIQMTSRHQDRWVVSSPDRRVGDAKTVDWSGATSFVSGIAGLLGGQATIGLGDVNLEIRPLRRVLIDVVDRETQINLEATVRGAPQVDRSRGRQYVWVPCGRFTTLSIDATGYRPGYITIGDRDGIPRLWVELDRE